MRDWEHFVRHVPWFADPADISVTGNESRWSRDLPGTSPNLAALLADATVTALAVAGQPFAPDHAFSRVTPLPGCPEYSLMTIDGVPDLASWIEECAAVWLKG